jgi:hypothetical protein
MNSSKCECVEWTKTSKDENVKGKKGHRRKTSNEGKRQMKENVEVSVRRMHISILYILKKIEKTLQLKSNYYLIGTKMVVMRKLYVLWILLKRRYSGDMLGKMVSKI